jgi:hypothetical protein
VGVIACGYADGYPRHAPNGTPVLVCGKKARLAGRPSMDMVTVDLTDVPEARVGSPVVLWGEGLPVDDVASAASTVGYELLCAVAPRVPHVTRGGPHRPRGCKGFQKCTSSSPAPPALWERISSAASTPAGANIIASTI